MINEQVQVWCCNLSWQIAYCQDQKTYPTIWRIAVRATCVSRHHGGPIEGLPETPRISQYCGIEEFKGGPQFLSPLCREILVPHNFFQSGPMPACWCFWHGFTNRLEFLLRLCVQPTERLACIGIMRTQWRAHWNPLNTTTIWGRGA